MKIFVLLLMVYGDGGSITSIEFTSAEACDTAGKASVEVFGKPILSPLIRYVCVEK